MLSDAVKKHIVDNLLKPLNKEKLRELWEITTENPQYIEQQIERNLMDWATLACLQLGEPIFCESNHQEAQALFLSLKTRLDELAQGKT